MKNIVFCKNVCRYVLPVGKQIYVIAKKEEDLSKLLFFSTALLRLRIRRLGSFHAGPRNSSCAAAGANRIRAISGGDKEPPPPPCVGKGDPIRER